MEDKPSGVRDSTEAKRLARWLECNNRLRIEDREKKRKKKGMQKREEKSVQRGRKKSKNRKTRGWQDLQTLSDGQLSAEIHRATQPGICTSIRYSSTSTLF